MHVSECVDKFSWLEIGDLGHHHGEQCVGCDIERYAEKDVCAALVELAGELSVDDHELEQGMT